MTRSTLLGFLRARRISSLAASRPELEERMKPRKLATLALVTAALLLAACTQQPVQPTPEGFVRLSVAFDAGSPANHHLSPMGLPFDPNDGTINLRDVQVTVSDRTGKDLVFSLDGGTYKVDASGSEPYIKLTTAASSANVLLPSAGNPYTFESVSYSNDDQAIGYDQRSQHVNVNGTVTIQLESVLGAATLAPRFPTHYATPGTELDLMLFVSANGHTDLQVPISDFTATYGTVVGGTLVSESNRGLRIKVADVCTTVEAGGVINGVRESSGTFSRDEPGPITDFSLDCVEATGGQLKADVEAPTVTILSFNPATGRIEGEASDNVAIAKVQIFDGPELVASTDSADIDNGAATITFLPASEQFYADLASTPGADRGFQAVAFDPSGNEGRSSETLNLSFVYVASNAAPDGNGSKERPFATIAAAVNAVNAGGVVYVQDGTYELPTLNIYDKSLTLRGQSETGTILVSKRADGSAPGYGMEVTADYVTLESFTLQGPGTGSVQGRGIHAAGSPVATTVLQGLVIRNVTIDGARQMGLSINTTNGTVLENVTVKNVNAGDEGIGINLKTSHNALLKNVTTDNNTIGISIETTKTTQEYANNDSRDITITGGSHNDLVGVMTEIYPTREITGLTLDPALGYTYAVRNTTPLTARNPACTGSGEQYTYYVTDLAAAEALKQEFCDPAATTVQEVSRTDASKLLAFTVPTGWSIQAAVNTANAGATINLAAGTHNSAGVAVNTPQLHITGANQATTVVKGTSPSAGYGLDLQAANVEISGLHLQDYYSGVNLGDAPGAYLHDLEFSSSGMALRTSTVHNVDGLRFEDSSIHDTTAGIRLQHGKTNTTPARNVTIDNVTLSDVAHKGFYLEAFADSTIQNVTMTRVANGPADTPGQASVALEVNLKYNDYGSITLRNLTITDSGWSDDGTFDGTTTPVHPNAAALAVAVRDDGSYASAPATLNNLLLDNVTITGTYNAIRLGEWKDLLAPTASFTTGATSTVLQGLFITNSGGHAIANYTLMDVDATASTNQINSRQVPTDNAAIEADLLDGADDSRLGVIRLEPIP